MSRACESRSTRGSSTISASAPTSATCCASSRGSITTLNTSCSAARPTSASRRSSGRISAASLEPSPNYSIREQIHVPWVLRRERPDVYHAPHYVLPPAVRCRSVVTIHDCIHLMFPQYLPNRAAYAYARALDVGGSTTIRSHPDRIRGVEARHPPLLQRPAGEDRRRLQRHRRALLARRRPRSRSRASASDTSSITSSCCTSATSSRTRISCG